MNEYSIFPLYFYSLLKHLETISISTYYIRAIAAAHLSYHENFEKKQIDRCIRC
jgi:hypothetical protein